MMLTFMHVAGWTALAMLVGAGVLHAIPKLGAPGRRVSAALCRAPLLDLPITYFTVAPLFVGPLVAGWAGLAGAVAGQVAGVLAWTVLHELTHRRDVRGPRIVKVINRRVGRVRNHAATWVTAVVTPVFWVIRVAELVVYPPLVKLVDLPAYRHADWVAVSRQKFQGLVGHDLIWCLYCDWMTGVWSLATEMLRNVESFWCPIRFDSATKCANCATDFPDVVNGWVPAHATMSDVTETLERMYGPTQSPRAWFGHPVRITVKGAEVEEREPETAGV